MTTFRNPVADPLGTCRGPQFGNLCIRELFVVRGYGTICQSRLDGETLRQNSEELDFLSAVK